MVMQVLIIHPFPEGGGGAEIQLYRNIKTLESLNFSITVLSIYKLSSIELQTLGEKCDIKIGNIKNISLFPFKNIKFFKFPILLGYAIALRKGNQIKDDFNMIHTIIGECPIEHPTVIQHFCIPLFSIKRKNLEFLGFFPKYNFEYLIRFFYIEFCKKLCNFNSKIISRHYSLANSKWTAKIVKNEYKDLILCKHIYFWPKKVFNKNHIVKPFKNRQRIIIMLGRIVRSKNYSLGLKLISMLNKYGLDYKLLIIGRSNTNYSKVIEKELKEISDNFEILFDAERKQIFKKCSTAMFGLHGFKFEHFGSASAEMRAAGLPTFVPAYGGQAEIAKKLFTYKVIEDIIEKILFFEKNNEEYNLHSKEIFDFSLNNNNLTYEKELKKHFKLFKSKK